MKLHTAVIMLASALVWGGCGTQRVLLGTDSSYLFTVTDALARPGEQSTLTGRVQAGDLLVGRAGYVVRFYRDGVLYKAAETDDDGFARVSYTPPAAGDHRFTADVAPAGLGEDPPAPRRLLVACRAPETRMVIVDLDYTLVATGFHTVLLGDPAPMAESQAMLQHLAKTHTIVYLTHRPDYFGPKSKAWLAKQKYPLGPVLLPATIGRFLRGSGAFKTDALRRLKERFANIEIGVGDKISDAAAYDANGLKSFLIAQVSPAATPEALGMQADALDALDARVQVVTTWGQIRKALLEGASYPRPTFQEHLRKLARQRKEHSSDTKP